MEYLSNFDNIINNYELESNIKIKEYLNRISLHLKILDLETSEAFYLKYIKTNSKDEIIILKDYYYSIYKYINKPYKNELAKIHDVHINEEDSYYEFVIILEYGESDLIDTDQITYLQIIKYVRNIINILKELSEYDLCLNNISLDNLVVVNDSIKISGYKPFLKLDIENNWLDLLYEKLSKQRYNLFLLGIWWIQFWNFDVNCIFDNLDYNNFLIKLNYFLSNNKIKEHKSLIKLLDFETFTSINLENIYKELEDLILKIQYDSIDKKMNFSEDYSENNKTKKDEFVFSIKNEDSKDNETCYFIDINNNGEENLNISFADKNMFCSNYNSNISHNPKKYNSIINEFDNKNYKLVLNKLENIDFKKDEEIEIWQIKIDCLYNLKQYKKAYDLWLNVKDLKNLTIKNKIEIYKKLSFCLNNWNNIIESIFYLEKCIKIFINNEEEINNEFFDLLEVLILMKIKNKQNDISNYIEFYTSYNWINKLNELKFNIITILINLKNYNLCLEYINDCINFFKEDSKNKYLVILFNKGICLLYLNNYNDSELVFLKLIKKCEKLKMVNLKEYYLSYLKLGIIEYSKENFKNCIKNLEKFKKFNLNLEKEKLDSIKLIGFCYFNLNNFEQCIENLEKIKINYNIENLNIIWMLFKSYLRCNLNKKAKNLIDKLKKFNLDKVDNDSIFKIYYYKSLYYEKINNLKEAESSLNIWIDYNIKIYGVFSDEHWIIIRLLLKLLDKKKDKIKKKSFLEKIIKYFENKSDLEKNILEHLNYIFFEYYNINRYSNSSWKLNIINKIKSFNENNKFLNDKEFNYIINEEKNIKDSKPKINKPTINNKINDYEVQIEEFFKRIIYLQKFGYFSQFENNFLKFQKIFSNKEIQITHKEEKILFINLNNLLIYYFKNKNHPELEDELFIVLQKLSEILIKDKINLFKKVLIVLFSFNNLNFIKEYFNFLIEENLIEKKFVFINDIYLTIIKDFEEEFFNNHFKVLNSETSFIINQEILSDYFNKFELKRNGKFLNINENFIILFYEFFSTKEIKDLIILSKKRTYYDYQLINKELIFIYFKIVNKKYDNEFYEYIKNFNDLIIEFKDFEKSIEFLLFLIYILFYIKDYYIFEKIDSILSCRDIIWENKNNFLEKEKLNWSIFFSKYGDIYFKFNKYEYCIEYKLNSLNLIKNLKSFNFEVLHIMRFNNLKEHLFNIFSYLCISYLKLNQTQNSIIFFEKLRLLKIENINYKYIKIIIEVIIWFFNEKFNECEKLLLKEFKFKNIILNNIYNLFRLEHLNKVYTKINKNKEFNRYKINYLKLKKIIIN